MPKYAPLTKNDLRDRIKEIEARIKQMDRREKTLGDFKKWIAHRKLEPADVAWMLKAMRPRRADKPVKSRNPLKPVTGRWADKERGPHDMMMKDGKLVPKKGDPVFRKAVHEKRIELGLKTGDLGKKIGVSDATISNWESGRNIPREEQRVKVLKVLDLPAELGREASAQMEIAFKGGRRPNGIAAHA